MVGDGATDMEASPPAVSLPPPHSPQPPNPLPPLQDLFIGFGGNVVREKVKEGAPWFVFTFQDLIAELEDAQTK